MIVRNVVERHVGFDAVPTRFLALVAAVGVSLLVGVAVGRGYALPVLGLAAFAAALLVGIVNWRWSVYGLLLYLPFSGIPVLAAYPHTAVPVLLKDFLFVIPAYVGFLVYVTNRGVRVPFAGAPLALFLMLAFLVAAQAFNPNLPSRLVGAIGIKVWLFYIPLYFLAYHFVRDRRDLFRLLGVMSVAAIIPAVIGIVEAVLIYAGHARSVYQLYGGAAQAATQNFAQFTFTSGGDLRRVPSTFSFVAQYYTFAISMVAVSYAWWRGALVGTRLDSFGRLVWLLMLVAAFLSGARGAFVFVPVLMLLIIVVEWLSPGSRVRSLPLGRILALGGVFLVPAALFSGAPGTIFGYTFQVGRQEFQSVFVDGFRQALALTWNGLGTGIDTNASRYAFSTPVQFQAVGGTWFESWYVKVVLELGIAGLVVVVLLLGVLVVRGVQAHRWLHDPRMRAISAALLAFLIWNLVYNVKGQYMDIDPIDVYFWLFAGLLARVATLDRDESEGQDAPVPSQEGAAAPSPEPVRP